MKKLRLRGKKKKSRLLKVKCMVWGGFEERSQSQTVSMIPHCAFTGIHGRYLKCLPPLAWELHEDINEVYGTGLCYVVKLRQTFSVKVQSKYFRLCGPHGLLSQLLNSAAITPILWMRKLSLRKVVTCQRTHHR